MDTRSGRQRPHPASLRSATFSRKREKGNSAVRDYVAFSGAVR